MGATAKYQLPYPEQADPADVPVDMKELCDRLETVLNQLAHGGAIPGEIRAWPGGALPALATYGHWAWADGQTYSTATYPIAAGNIATVWRTAFGAADPGAGNFRVPDLRGLVLVGLDAMPGGARANRMARAAAATQAARTGEEFHTLTTAELASHTHTIGDPAHGHSGYSSHNAIRLDSPSEGGGSLGAVPISGAPTYYPVESASIGVGTYNAYTGVYGTAQGGGGAHENVPPATFVPYIVKLDD